MEIANSPDKDVEEGGITPSPFCKKGRGHNGQATSLQACTIAMTSPQGMEAKSKRSSKRQDSAAKNQLTHHSPGMEVWQALGQSSQHETHSREEAL